MVGLRSSVFSLISLLMVGAAFAAPTEIPFGENKKLGVSFQVNGGQEWCSPKVKISLDAKKPSVLTENSEEFQHMLGRIRAIVEGSCPQVRLIHYQGMANGAEVTIGESAQFTNWVYVPQKIEGKRPPCAGPDNPALCDQRWNVFLANQIVFARPGFEKLVVTRYLTTEEGADIEFVAGDASGRVSFVNFESGVPFKTSTEFVEYQVQKLRSQCTGTFTEGEVNVLDLSSTMQGVTCATGTAFQHSYFLIRQAPAGFEVTGFSDFTRDGNAARQLAARFAAVVTRAPIVETGWPDVKSDVFLDSSYPKLGDSPCGQTIESYVGLDSKAVAVRVLPEGERDSQQLTLRVFVGDPQQIKSDRWRMRVKLHASEIDNVWMAADLASWLVFKIEGGPGGRYFENQLFLVDGPSCAPLRGTNKVTVASMPTRAVELFAEGLGITATADGSETALRAALEQWSRTETPH